MTRLPLAATAVVALLLGACGGSDKSPSSPRSRASVGSTATTGEATDYARVDADHDNDVGTSHDDTNNDSASKFGHEAREPEKRQITALVKSYYANALTGDGAKACAMIYSPLAESVPEDYGLSAPPGPPYMKGTTCPVVLHGMLEHFHSQLAAEVPQMKVTAVRLVEHHGVVELSFGALPQRETLVIREGPTWRMSALLDRELP